MTRLLHGKTAIIYGGGGSIGGAVARTFAREGARVFLAGRTRATLENVAADIAALGSSGAGATADVDEVDALDERAVDAHARSVVERAGRIDISFNLVQRGDVQGVPLLDLSPADLLRPVTNGVRTAFLTARAAARQMAAQGGGVILYLTSGSSAGLAPMMGGTGPADAAVETLMRYLAAENGRAGVRVTGIWTAAVAETLDVDKMRAVAGDNAPTPEQIEQMFAQMTMLGRQPRLEQVAETAAFLASDRASGITADIANVTCGLVSR